MDPLKSSINKISHERTENACAEAPKPETGNSIPQGISGVADSLERAPGRASVSSEAIQGPFQHSPEDFAGRLEMLKNHVKVFSSEVDRIRENIHDSSQVSDTMIQSLGQGCTNVMSLLYVVMEGSISEDNEDKKYFLQKLQDYNTISDAMSDSMKDLSEASKKLSEKEANSDEGMGRFTLEPWAKEDLEGKLDTVKTSLSDVIAETESLQETVRNKRQMGAMQFRNFEQRAVRIYNLLASVMKAMSEMRTGTVRNML